MVQRHRGCGLGRQGKRPRAVDHVPRRSLLRRHCQARSPLSPELHHAPRHGAGHQVLGGARQ